MYNKNKALNVKSKKKQNIHLVQVKTRVRDVDKQLKKDTVITSDVFCGIYILIY